MQIIFGDAYIESFEVYNLYLTDIIGTLVHYMIYLKIYQVNLLRVNVSMKYLRVVHTYTWYIHIYETILSVQYIYCICIDIIFENKQNKLTTCIDGIIHVYMVCT